MSNNYSKYKVVDNIRSLKTIALIYLQWSWSRIAIKIGFFVEIGMPILLNDINQHFGR